MLKKRRLALADFTRHPLILPGEATYCRKHFDNTLARAGLLERTRIVIESNFPLMLFEYVRSGFGVAISPVPAETAKIDVWLKNGVMFRPIPELLGSEPIYFVRRKGRFETPVAARFRQLVTAPR